jgi:hypothetical protein
VLVVQGHRQAIPGADENQSLLQPFQNEGDNQGDVHMSYKIVRHFADPREEKVVITRGLTLEQAQEHCNDPETSSRTAKSQYHRNLTKSAGPWFDGYYEE